MEYLCSSRTSNAPHSSSPQQDRGRHHRRYRPALPHDDCRTWSEPVVTNLRNPNAGIDIALGKSGRLLLTYNDSYLLRLPLCVGISDDMGKTFRVRDVETKLATPRFTWWFGNYTNNCYAYPKLIQTRDETWHLFYTHQYDCIKHVWFDEKWLEKGRKVIGLDE